MKNPLSVKQMLKNVIVQILKFWALSFMFALVSRFLLGVEDLKGLKIAGQRSALFDLLATRAFKPFDFQSSLLNKKEEKVRTFVC